MLFLTVKESDLYYVSGGYVADQKRENIEVEAYSFLIVTVLTVGRPVGLFYVMGRMSASH